MKSQIKVKEMAKEIHKARCVYCGKLFESDLLVPDPVCDACTCDFEDLATLQEQAAQEERALEERLKRDYKTRKINKF